MPINANLEPEPLVTFLIPTYNRAHLLQECVESILAQTYKNIEIIVIDDGSSDNTEGLVNSRFRRAKFYKNKVNRGVAYSRNLGLTHATGKYIGLLDSDDVLLEPDYVRMAVKMLESHPELSVFTCDAYCINLEGRKIYEKTFFQTTQDHRGIELCSGIKDFDYVFSHGVHSCGAVFRKLITDEIGFLNTGYKIAWDEDFLLRVAASEKFKIYYCNSPLVAYRIHSDNLSNNQSDLYREKIKVRTDMLRLNPNFKKQLGAKFKRRLANQYYCLADAYVKEKRIPSSLSSLFNAVAIYPPIAIILIKKILTLGGKKLKRV